MKTTALASLLAISALFSLGAAQGEASTENATLTFHLELAEQPPEDQVVELRYALPTNDGGRPQVRVVRFCGGAEGPEVDQIVTEDACRSDTPYTATLDVPRDQGVAFQAFTLRAQDPEGTYRTLVQNFDGEMPDAPEDFVTYDDGTTHWIWVAGDLAQ